MTTRTIKAGGAKGAAIIQAIEENPGATRKQIAETVGCTVGRVGEVVRWLAENGTEDERELVTTLMAGRQPKPKDESAEDDQTAAQDTPVPDSPSDEETTEEAGRTDWQGRSGKEAYDFARELQEAGESIYLELLDVANEYAKKAKVRRITVSV